MSAAPVLAALVLLILVRLVVWREIAVRRLRVDLMLIGESAQSILDSEPQVFRRATRAQEILLTLVAGTYLRASKITYGGQLIFSIGLRVLRLARLERAMSKHSIQHLENAIHAIPDAAVRVSYERLFREYHQAVIRYYLSTSLLFDVTFAATFVWALVREGAGSMWTIICELGRRRSIRITPAMVIGTANNDTQSFVRRWLDHVEGYQALFAPGGLAA